MSPHVSLPALREVAARWPVTELSLFGSVLRDDFRDDSDVDVLVTFAPDAPLDLWDFIELQHELERALGHRVDLVDSTTLSNPFRRREILRTKQTVYVAA